MNSKGRPAVALFLCRGSREKQTTPCSHGAGEAAQDRLQDLEIPEMQPGELGREDEEGRDGSVDGCSPCFSLRL